ncbi:hypothetical protein [Marinoscillum furvescens]|uniref:Uncharacterized protein n=1 Tax=Marinoscillum furvescens DSM 4134 TaxID=1122208 RepID=A0A3D9L6I7_MARFU|nr:hypothetical protein [Marinoscillum furvescens]REE01790.1 hypothetical protein C7460_103308 [Marinoscillum furvescens DSM 4134]
MKKAVEAGFDFNGTTNGLAIEKFVKKTGTGRHGPHPKYTDQLRGHLDWWARQPGNANFTPDDAKTYLDALANNLKTKINTSSLKINDLALGLPK